MAVIRSRSSLPRRSSVANVHEHITQRLGKGDIPSGRRIGRDEDTIVTPIPGGEGLIDERYPIVSKISNDAHGSLQPVADIRATACLHGYVPSAGSQLQFVAPVHRHPIAILATGVRRQLTFIKDSTVIVIAVPIMAKRRRATHPDV